MLQATCFINDRSSILISAIHESLGVKLTDFGIGLENGYDLHLFPLRRVETMSRAIFRRQAHLLGSERMLSLANKLPVLVMSVPEIAENLLICGIERVALCSGVSHVKTSPGITQLTEDECNITDCSYLKAFSFVVLDISMISHDLVLIEEACRIASISCVIVGSRGSRGIIAITGGGKVRKSSSIACPICIVSSIAGRLVNLLEDQPHTLGIGDSVLISDRTGVSKEYEVTEVHDKYSFSVNQEVIADGDSVRGKRQVTELTLPSLTLTTSIPIPGFEFYPSVSIEELLATEPPPHAAVQKFLFGIATQTVISILCGFGNILMGTYGVDFEVSGDLELNKVLVVGAGACGSAMVEMLVELGVKSIDLIDAAAVNEPCMGRSRLFRDYQGKNKAKTVADQIESVHAIETPFDSLDDDYWSSLSLVVSAVNDGATRKSIESRTVYNRVELCDIGVEGVMGHIEHVIPFKTNLLGTEQSVKKYPPCVVTSFPTRPEHNVQWSRELFDECFYRPGLLINNALKATEKVNEQACMDVLDSIGEDPVYWAVSLFTKLYRDYPLQLLHHFPLDTLTATGESFWSGKRIPHPVQFDVSDQTHVDLVTAASTLRCHFLGVVVTSVASRLHDVHIAAWKPQGSVSIATDGESTIVDGPVKCTTEKVQSRLRDMKPLVPIQCTEIQLHTDFLVCATNLRCDVYSLPQLSVPEITSIAFGAVPALPALYPTLSALGGIELFKKTQRRNVFLNIGDPSVVYETPSDPIGNVWGRVEVDGRAMTLREVLDKIHKDTGNNVSIMTVGSTIVYSEFMMPKKLSQRMDCGLFDMFSDITGQVADYVSVEVVCEDDSGEDIEIPSVRIRIQ